MKPVVLFIGVLIFGPNKQSYLLIGQEIYYYRSKSTKKNALGNGMASKKNNAKSIIFIQNFPGLWLDITALFTGNLFKY